MGKRSNFSRIDKDKYDTPYAGVLPLLSHLETGTSFIEPFAGAAKLASHLTSHGHECVFMSDIEPRSNDVARLDFFEMGGFTIPAISNPPWKRDKKSDFLLHRIIERARVRFPCTWLLLDADWAFTKQAAPYMKYCSKFVAVGRLKWIPGSKHTGKENCAWYRFESEPCETVFYGRVK